MSDDFTLTHCRVCDRLFIKFDLVTHMYEEHPNASSHGQGEMQAVEDTPTFAISTIGVSSEVWAETCEKLKKLEEYKEKAEAFDWREAQKQTCDVRFDEVEGWVVEDILDRRWAGDTLLEAIQQAKKAGEG